MKNLTDYVLEAMNILETLGIDYEPVKWKTFKNKKSWGICRKKPAESFYTLEFNEVILQDNISYEATMNTVVHELLHAHKDRMCHTGEWKRCASMINRHYTNLNIQRCTSAEDKGIDSVTYAKSYKRRTEHPKYMVTCNNCGNINYYSRKSKVITLLTMYPNAHGCYCGKCKSRDLKIDTL